MEAVNQTLYVPEAGCYTVFNNSNWVRSGAAFLHMTDAELSHYKGDMVIDEDGQEVKAVWKEKGVLIWIFQIQPFSFSAFRLVTPKTGHTGAELTDSKVGASQIDTPFYTISWNEKGQLNRIYDKKKRSGKFFRKGNAPTYFRCLKTNPDVLTPGNWSLPLT